MTHTDANKPHGPILTVEREGHEGVIQIDGMTGLITTPPDERPDWADGLACALLNERNEFYTKRLDQVKAGEHHAKALLSFDDLSWLAVDEDGKEVELEAHADYRMDQLATSLGIDRGNFDAATAEEIETAYDTSSDEEKLAREVAMHEAQEMGFPATGTKG